MASLTGFNVDPQRQGPAATQQLNESLDLSMHGLHINIYCHTVIIERPPVSTAAQPIPVDQAPLNPEPPRGVWAPSSGIPGFKKTLYWNILDRDAESQKVVDDWTQHTYTHGLAQTVYGFFDALKSTPRGQEMSTEVIVDKFYLAVLGRHPEAAGRVHWTEKLNNGMSLLEAAKGFIGSPEYRGKVEAGTRPGPIHWPV